MHTPEESTPAEVPIQTPADAPTEIPVQDAPEIPGDAPAEIPGETPVEIPGDAPAEIPVQDAPGTSSIVLMDTGDYVTVGFVENPRDMTLGQSWILVDGCVQLVHTVSYPSTMLELAQHLYKKADIDADIVETNLFVDNELQDFIGSSIELIEPWTEDAGDTLTKNLHSVIDYWKIKNIMKKRRDDATKNKKAQDLSSVVMGSYARADLSNVAAICPPDMGDLARLDIRTDKQWYSMPISEATREKITAVSPWNNGTSSVPLHDLRKSPVDSSNVGIELAPTSGCKIVEGFDDKLPYASVYDGIVPRPVIQSTSSFVTIVYNELLSMMFVIYDRQLIVDRLCTSFPEFHKIQRFNLPESLQAACNTVLDCQLVNNKEHAKQMVDSFKVLYKLDASVNNLPVDEKATVLDIIKTEYITSDDPTMKMQASALFFQITNRMFVSDPVEVRSLKQRLPAYMLAAGLKKKRAKEGYFYYGIKPMFQAIGTSDFEILQQQRENDLKLISEKRLSQKVITESATNEV